MIRTVVLIGGLLGPGVAWGQTVTIGGTPYSTLADALGSAVAGDTIAITSGTLTESGPLAVPVSVTIAGAGSTSTTLKSSGGEEILDLNSNVSLTLRDIKLLGTGTSQRALSETNSGTSLTMTDVVVDAADSAGEGGNLYITKTTGVTLTRVQFLGNGASGFLGTDGGALHVEGTGTQPVTLTDVTFTDSRASGNGGAIFAKDVALSCDSCTFSGANASTAGGAIFAQGGTVTARRSRFCASHSGLGGAIYGDTSVSATLTNDIFGQGTATSGGGIYAGTGTWNVFNNHFIGNSGGGALETVDSTANLTAVNNLFLNSTSNAIKLGASGSPSITFNWFQGNGGTVLNYSGALPTSNQVNKGDPKLVGTVTDCLNAALYPTPLTSPLIDVGDSTITDLDGTRSDIGAFGGPETDPASPVAFDSDGDGDAFLHDCDDDDRHNYPENDETCGQVGDNDCDGLADDDDPNVTDQKHWHADCDLDDFGTSAVTTACDTPTPNPCGGTGQWVSEEDLDGDASRDCDDTDAAINPNADEHCDGVDEDCDVLIDDDAVDAATYYTDADNDGYGDPATEVKSCTVSAPDTADNPDDCNDQDPDIHPNQPDPCDAGHVDQDCGGADGDSTNSEPYYVDKDEDGFGSSEVGPTFSCDPLTSGYSTNHTDCDDGDKLVNPSAAEVCNLVDDDCNTEIDDVGSAVDWYQDLDGDAFGDDVFTVSDDCPPAEGWVQVAGDCDDDNIQINPGVAESCDGIDDNCDGLLDDQDPAVTGGGQLWLDFDGDGYGACDPLDPECRPKAVCLDYNDQTWADNPDDCDDANPAVNPSQSEIPGNDIDEDCVDGAADPPNPGEIAGGGGCNCATGPAPVAPWLLLAGLSLLTLRRRR